MKWIKQLGLKAVSRIFPYRISSDLRFWYTYRRFIDWKHPRDLNEWIHLLIEKSDAGVWAMYADKVRVREYVKSKGLGHILLPQYGVWDDASKIDFASLPAQFVLKTNHGCCTNIIVRDKDSLDKEAARSRMNSWLRQKFGRETGERHYRLIPPRILAEKLIDPARQHSGADSIVDYKIWCVFGQPKYIFVSYDRSDDLLTVDLYDTDWQRRNELLNYGNGYILPERPMPRPECLDEMLRYASVLAADEPEARIDFYEVDGRPVFGEITLTSCGGKMSYFKDSFLKEIGEAIAQKYRINHC